MFRSVITLALSVFLVAEASAQTAPAATPKSTAKATAKSANASARAAKKARKVAVKSAPKSPVINDGWPALEELQTAVATSATSANEGWEYGNAGASTSRGELDNANVYAAPGMPVHIRTSKVPVPYSVRPPRKPAATSTQTTLGN
ncbi:hypothetical protein [Hymenobacter arizonensis]|uniref:Uncharacterized protein n=1 Tax=Hymenobacter arizonensis TaxID=1227077 RepID=A0A1I5WN19_HYMAR|nr:hypothetical protein [Hymenobacter arizonensis]SFQ21185.1 hypothetical protein SAMN04515668_1405 [Hymenobacter arizonensis]